MIVALTRRHHQRLRDVYRSSGWPCQDMLEVKLLACGLLEWRTTTPSGHESLRRTDAGMVQLAQAHEALWPSTPRFIERISPSPSSRDKTTQIHNSETLLMNCGLA